MQERLLERTCDWFLVEQTPGYKFHRLIYDEAGLERVVIVERVGT